MTSTEMCAALPSDHSESVKKLQDRSICNPASFGSLSSIESKWPESPTLSSQPNFDNKHNDLEDEHSIHDRVLQAVVLTRVNEEAITKTLCKAMWRMASGSALIENENLAPFSVGTVPKMELFIYVSRCVGYLNEVFQLESTEQEGLTPGFVMLVHACVYIERLMEKHPSFSLDSTNVHRLLLTCIVVATKQNRDKTIPNRFMARVGGVNVSFLARFEMELCKMLDFELHVRSADFVRTLITLLPPRA